MFIIGKIFGALLGLMLTHNIIGFWLGLLIGHLFDKGLKKNIEGGFYTFNLNFFSQQGIVQQVFFKTTFLIMGCIAKADGRVSENEIQMAIQVMNEFGLNQLDRQQAMEFFNQGKISGFDWEKQMREFRRVCGHQRALCQIFIEIQFRLVTADGINLKKQALLQRIANTIRVSSNFYHYAQEEYEPHRQSYQSFRGTSPEHDLNHAYALLEITPSVDNASVKKAYRRMMSQHHPDKLVAKGLPESMIKIATEKTQRIRKAYESICAARGME